MTRYDLTDEEFELLKPLLPPEHSGEPGCPYRSHRQVLNGLFWILRTGAPWRDLPSRYGPWTTGYDRFRRWRKEGLWHQVLEERPTPANWIASILALAPSTAVVCGRIKRRPARKKSRRPDAEW